MFTMDLWQWWYASGWFAAVKWLSRLLKRQLQEFSVSLLFKTLFAPWKQTINVAGPNTPVQARLQWWVGNQVSRFIGLFIRVSTLIIALVVVMATALLGIAILLTWFFMPVLTVLFLIVGLVALWA